MHEGLDNTVRPDQEQPAHPRVSVCILAGHGADALQACLQSLRAQHRPPSFELLIGGNPGTQALAVVHREFPQAQICQTGRRRPGAARNPLIERARGELLLFLDDDVIAPGDLLGNLVRLADDHPESSVFGGPNETPLDSSTFQTVQGAVLSSLLGSGPVSRRYGARHACFADERWFTLCNLAVRRRAMSPFLSELSCAEENALLSELRNRGERMRYEPSLRVSHARRPTWRGFVRQMFKYGRGRGELIRREPTGLRLAYLLPSGLLLYLPLALILIGVGAPLVPCLVPAAAYCLLLAGSGAQIGRTLQSSRRGPLAVALTVTVHVCYGAGLLRGLFTPGRAPAAAPPRWSTGPGHHAASAVVHRGRVGATPVTSESEHGA